HALVVLTARAAARFAAGGAVPPALLPDRVFSLTDGVLKAMIVTRLRLIAGAAVLGLGMLGLGTAATLAQRPAPAPAAANNPFDQDDEEVAAAQQPPAKGKAAGKAKAPEKVVAKGVEDDDVPYPTVPTQAVVRLEDGKIVVRQRARVNAAVYAESDGKQPPAVSYRMETRVVGQKYDASDVSVFDMEGNRVLPKKWKDVLAKDTHALVAFDGRLPNPRELTLFKPDVLLIVFPAGTGGAYGVWGQQGYGTATSADGLFQRYDTPNGQFVLPTTAAPAQGTATAPPAVAPAQGPPRP
ncbi:MAG: hypothetical protein K2X82_02630, partial [Gemmataceae bacterium]|nr:hypothetical protein [Gemmataceae bacterium]